MPRQCLIIKASQNTKNQNSEWEKSYKNFIFLICFVGKNNLRKVWPPLKIIIWGISGLCWRKPTLDSTNYNWFGDEYYAIRSQFPTINQKVSLYLVENSDECIDKSLCKQWGF